MVDRRPQDFPNGTPDGVTDNTLAIQAAINAWLPGDQVIISGGTFRTSHKLTISQNGLSLTGTGSIRARSVFPINSSLVEVTATGVTIDADGLTLDQADMMFNGISIRALAAVGLQILGVISRGTQCAFLSIEADTTDLLLAGCDHLGRGYGVLAPDPPGLTRITVRDSTFEHVGNGSGGDGVEFNCRTYGASFVDVVGCSARKFIGEATDQGMGFGFSGVTDGRLIGCQALQCEGDGFHRAGFESLALRGSDRPGRRNPEPGRRQWFRADRVRQRRHHRRPHVGQELRLSRDRAQRSDQPISAP